MKEKLKKALRNSKVYQLEECTIDSLMRIDSSCTNCLECLYDLCEIEDEGIICGVEVNDDLYGIR